MIEVPPIVLSGSIAIDRIMNFKGSYSDHIEPDKLDSISISIFLDSLVDTYGGVAANIAYTLALLGESPVLLGSVGKDAQSYIEKLTACGVDVAHIHKSNLPTASFNVITDSNQNQVGGFYPGAMFDSDTLTLAPWKAKSPIVVVSPHDPKAMRNQVRQCREWDLRLCYDIGQQVTNLSEDDMREGLATAEVLILNEYELAVLSKKTSIGIEKIKNEIPIVVTTLGKDGSIIEGASLSSSIKVGISQPENITDPTGAGDAYRAGFLYGLAREWSLEACGQLGAVCSAYVVEQSGTQTHHFKRSEIAERYMRSFGKSLPDNLRKD